MKVAICGLIGSENLGEKFIATSLRFLIEKEYKKYGNEEISFIEVDIEARNDVILEAKGFKEKRIKNFYMYKKKGLMTDLFNVFLKRLARKIPYMCIKNFIYITKHIIWKYSCNFRKRHYLYYCEKFKNIDIIVIDGAGLLEYSYNEYQEPLYLISKYAEENNIPIVYNAVGCAGEFNEKDYRCKILKKAIQANSVKYVSARDSLEIVQKYVGNKQKVKLLADAAFWTSEAYQIQKNCKKNLIGIGLVRGDALLSYNVKFREEDWIRLFSEIALELKNRGYDFIFFTNGFPDDYVLGKKIIQHLKIDPRYLIDRPSDPKLLLSTISQCECLITCRMHSSIAAFSMNIPSIILSWNTKVDKYMDIIGYPQRVIKVNQFNAKYIVDSMELAKHDGISSNSSRKMRLLSKESVDDYISLIKDI